ncbi:Membrane protein involved in the export of O-antigen and teichoic acid [Lentzea fradiae]|uniref:Membrane protein involved in the export of O-antigen and teichoic acid n=1 Tax=Lentzea fradiae TaxID=200378 RepID=A0A1G7KRZ9_9PSEU|nr:polysaccharide biosynthesis protein [Lentzea fradiae]SDF39992.1 Membrane protein involved in the export of O-antigen and teichoic acid [Lentzea fradiae]
MSAPAPTTTRLDALLITGALLGANAASYVLTIAAARILAPAVFGELSALLALVVIGVVPAMSLQTVAALRVTSLGPRPLFGLGLAVSAGMTVLTLAAVPLLARLLHLDGPWPVVWLALSLAPLTVLGVLHGLLQGTHRFGSLALLVSLEGLGKVGGGVLGLWISPTSASVLAGTAAGSFLVVLTGWRLCGRPRPARPAGGPDVLHASQAMLALVLLVNLDLVLARHQLADQAGGYAVGAVVTKIAYWLPQAIGVLVLPRMAVADDRRRMLPRALAVCAGLDAFVVAGCALFGPLGVALVGGANYEGDSIPLWQFALVGSCLALVQLLLFSRIASGDRRSTLAVWIAVAAEVALITLWLNDSVGQVVTGALLATAGLVVAGTVIEARGKVRA